MIITEMCSLFRKQGTIIRRLTYEEAFDILGRQCGQGIEKWELIGRDDFETGKGARLVVVEAIGTECWHEVHDEIVDGAVTRVDVRLGVFQRVVDALDDKRIVYIAALGGDVVYVVFLYVGLFCQSVVCQHFPIMQTP